MKRVNTTELSGIRDNGKYCKRLYSNKLNSDEINKFPKI